MVTALGGCGAAAVTVQLASVKANVELAFIDKGNEASMIGISAPGAMSGEAQHV